MTAKRIFPQTDATQTEPRTPQKEADIKRLLFISKAEEAIANHMDFILMEAWALADEYDVIAKGDAGTIIHEEIHKLFWERMLEPNGFFDQIIPIYDKLFTHEEIKQCIAFYDTPLGKKAADAGLQFMNLIMTDFPRISQQIESEVPDRILPALNRAGLLPKSELTEKN